MPVYEFACKECLQEFKALRPVDKVAGVRCPECGAPRVVRLLSVTGQAQGTQEACAAPSGFS